MFNKILLSLFLSMSLCAMVNGMPLCVTDTTNVLLNNAPHKRSEQLNQMIKKVRKKQKEDIPIWRSLGFWSLVTAIVGAILIRVPYISIFGLLIGIGAFVLGILGIKRRDRKRLAIWGLIIGSLTIIFFLTILSLVLFT